MKYNIFFLVGILYYILRRARRLRMAEGYMELMQGQGDMQATGQREVAFSNPMFSINDDNDADDLESMEPVSRSSGVAASPSLALPSIPADSLSLALPSVPATPCNPNTPPIPSPVAASTPLRPNQSPSPPHLSLQLGATLHGSIEGDPPLMSLGGSLGAEAEEADTTVVPEDPDFTEPMKLLLRNREVQRK